MSAPGRTHFASARWLPLLTLALPLAAAAATRVPPPADPRELGRPPELLTPAGARTVGDALLARGIVDDPTAPLALRAGLITAQERADLAPTGWLDEDTAKNLGLDPARVLPVAAGAGSMHTSGATAGGGMVGGVPGPASPVPSAAELGTPVGVSGDASFHLAEARRLAASAESLRLRARCAETPRDGKRLQTQARKADRVASTHEKWFRDAGGEAALAGESVMARP